MMYKISVVDENNPNKEDLLCYEGSILPMAGDTYAALSFKDQIQRTVVNRLLIPNVPTSIVVYTKITFPNLHK